MIFEIGPAAAVSPPPLIFKRRVFNYTTTKKKKKNTIKRGKIGGKERWDNRNINFFFFGVYNKKNAP